MTSVLLAYEDRYHQELHRTVKRAVAAQGGAGARLEPHAVRGVSRFAGFVRDDWPRFRHVGFPVRGKPRLDRLVCVADADAIARELPHLPPPPAGDTEAWVREAEAAFEAHLRAAAADRPDVVHGALIRWSWESLAIATFDHPPSRDELAGPSALGEGGLGTFLDACRPDPRRVTDVLAFRRPTECLAGLAGALGRRAPAKGEFGVARAVEVLARADVGRLMGRVPDLARLAARVRTLAATT